jgi:SAM-dependent methyltransferase
MMISEAPSKETLTVDQALQKATSHAHTGHHQEMLATCRQIIENHGNNINALLDVGVLLLNFGFLSHARDCLARGRILAPHDPRLLLNIANLAHEAGDHPESRRQYDALLEQLPDTPVVRRNALVSLEYDPHVLDPERLAQAKAWGEWAMARAGGVRSRPVLRPLVAQPLRIGYLSADFCQHTVGLFVKDVIVNHDHNRVAVFAYSAGQVRDWVTSAIGKACTFRDVSAMDDSALAERIRQDDIDVLVDLSGHTAGSRLMVFAHRPAPVLISWLGYFATTGLPYIDAVLLDEWHAPPGIEAQFVEPILRLPLGRFCYQPVPWSPAEVAAPPYLQNGFITFGCFNNTAKLNHGVFEVWAKILDSVPDSRLILKWRTFADESLCQSVWESFAARGISPERIELRCASFHVDVMKEYAGIDIALDPFPFTGGLTSCEALWMGVPVVTWPQSRVVSRQSFAFLSAIGLPELAAEDADDYVRIAETLAVDRNRLTALRNELRTRMQASHLMDVTGFTRQLENTLLQLYMEIEEREKEPEMNTKTILHVGPGHRKSGAKLPPAFQSDDWREVRIDIDTANEPDIVGSMLDMAAVMSESVDAIYSAHNIEHVYQHEVPLVLKEFLRVLKPDGFLLITCPDLQTVCALVAEDKLTDTAYQSSAGPITPLDMLYGHGASLLAGNSYMAHKCGFTERSLLKSLTDNGFATIASKRSMGSFALWALASKNAMPETRILELARLVFPN